MSDSTLEQRLASPWWPITDPCDLKHLGKLLEELGECTAAASRCLIQGLDQAEPVTGKINRDWLEDEVADVLANLLLVQDRFGLDLSRIGARMARKTFQLKAWHGMLEP